MSKPGLSYGLNLGKKSGAKPVTSRPKPGGIFGGGDDSDSEHNEPKSNVFTKSSSKAKARTGAPPSAPPKSKKSQISMYGDLSSALESRKNAEAAEELDASIYDYDGVYDSIKPEKKVVQEDVERRPKYMKSLIASAAVRKRDALIAEEKKIARERDAEGEEFADKEKFVTEAYKKQQEENRKIEEEERRREEEEVRKNKGGGMTAFYKDLLNRGDQRHTEMMKAAEDQAKNGPQEDGKNETSEEKTASATDKAKKINAKGGTIAINEDGEVVDKRELLRGGLNVGAKKKPDVRQERKAEHRDNWDSKGGSNGGGKNAMRERQSRMMEAQLEQTLKRSLEEEEEEKQQVERAAKSRKTETDISSAKERYLARKKAAEEARKNSS